MTSIRSAEDQFQIPRSTLKRILKQLLTLYPYKLQTLRSLLTICKQRLLALANHFLTQPCGVAEYLARIAFSDECIYRTAGYVNKRMFGFRQKKGRHKNKKTRFTVLVLWICVQSAKLRSQFFISLKMKT